MLNLLLTHSNTRYDDFSGRKRQRCEARVQCTLRARTRRCNDCLRTQAKRSETLRTCFVLVLLCLSTPRSQAFQRSLYKIPRATSIAGSIRKASVCIDGEAFTQNNFVISPTRKPLPKERKHGLKAMRNQSWEDKFDKLVAFKEKHGHADVPQRPNEQVKEVDPDLAIFCRNLRYQYKLLQSQETRNRSFLTKDRIDRLEALGFVWNLQEGRWNLRYNELRKFWETHQHSNVPTNWEENPDLSKWVSYQRQRNRGEKLSNDQINLLEQVDFRWSPKDAVWWENYAKLKAFKECHGHFRVPCPKLRRWKDHLRRLCREYVIAVSIEGTTDVHVSGLNKQRLAALTSVNFCWMPEYGGNLQISPPDDIFHGYH